MSDFTFLLETKSNFPSYKTIHTVKRGLFKYQCHVRVNLSQKEFDCTDKILKYFHFYRFYRFFYSPIFLLSPSELMVHIFNRYSNIVNDYHSTVCVYICSYLIFSLGYIIRPSQSIIFSFLCGTWDSV